MAHSPSSQTEAVFGARAVVIGAGVGGLLAAAAVRPFFGETLIIEKDPLVPSAAPRKGVPQGTHVHALLRGGEDTLERLVPGTRTKMLERGSVPVRSGMDLRFFESGRWQPVRDLGITMHTQTRGNLEWAIRDALLADPQVIVAPRERVTDFICPSATNGRAKVEQVVSTSAAGDETRRAADLVIDCRGRGNSLVRWLARAGFGPVPEERCGMDICYVTGIFAIPDDWKAGPVSRVLRPEIPDRRSGTLAPIEHNRWLLTLTGRFGDFPPTDLPGFLDFARSLADPEIYELVRQAELVTDIYRYRIPDAYWRHFEQAPGLPVGLLPLGDVIGSFNPIYAQGMSIAAQQAECLRLALDETARSGGPLSDVGARYLPAAAKRVESAWKLSTAGDFAYPETTGTRPPDFSEQLARRTQFQRGLQRLADQDPDVHRLSVRVKNLLEPPQRLRDPALYKRILRAAEEG